MSKTITYSGLVISGLLVILAFVTAKKYTQLAGAVVLYPLVAYFALKAIPRGKRVTPAITINIPVRHVPKTKTVTRNKVDVADIEKRTFLRLVGAAGVSFFLFSLFGRRVESLLFGQALEPKVTGDTPNKETGPAQPLPTDGYRISEIDDSDVTFYGFVNQDGAWFIMKENPESGSFRYAKGDLNFQNNWVKRENLKYAYFHELF